MVSRKRTIAVVTVARSDYGILRRLLAAIRDASDLELSVVAAGMHLAPAFGYTVADIEADGFTVDHRVDMLLASDTQEGAALSTGTGIMGFGRLFARFRPDVLLLTGDRFEMFAAAVAALHHAIPIAHLHGGEITEGAIDDAFRHAISKMAQLHFVATEANRKVLRQLGEEDGRIVVCGAPALDAVRDFVAPDSTALEREFGISLEAPPLLVTWHPTTKALAETEAHTGALLDALSAFGAPTVFTLPNADSHGRIIRRQIEAYVADRPDAWLVPNFGADGYFAMMSQARAMVGNSSSGIIEAASFKLPVVNIGDRQRGRACARNVVHAAPETDAIVNALRRATEPSFAASLVDLENSYGVGNAVETIVSTLRKTPAGRLSDAKRFATIDLAGLPRIASVTVERIIARLDVKGPNVIKGVHLEGLKVVGKPREMARRYYDQSADEIVFMDVVASLYGRNNLLDVVNEAGSDIFIPMIVGGGIRTVEDITAILRAGADKVAINTAAISRPAFLSEAAERFGSQCIVLSIEAKRRAPGQWEALTDNGRETTGKDAAAWAKEGEALGVGEILVTSVDQEGTQKGFDRALMAEIHNAVEVPVIACGGAGSSGDVSDLLGGRVSDAVCCASLFHYDICAIPDLKRELLDGGFQVRA